MDKDVKAMISTKSYVLVLLMWLVTLGCVSQTLPARTHEVKPGETLYGISVRYGVPVSELKAENGLISDALVAGQVLRIVSDDGISLEKPKCRLMYEVQKKETIYSICKKFDISEDEFYSANPILREKKLKKRQLVCIPFKRDVVREEVVVEDIEEVVSEPLKVVFILPFGLRGDKVSSANLKMLDFYEGFLLALESVKSMGVSVDVHVYDESDMDSTGVLSYVGNGKLDGTDILFGPYDPAHVEQLASYANRNDIKMIVPFISKQDYTKGNPNVFQLNVVTAAFYSKVYDLFLEKNEGCKLVFALSNDRSDNVLYFEGFKARAKERGFEYEVFDMSALDDLQYVLKPDCRNVFIPISTSEKVLGRLSRTLDNIENLDSANIAIFGQPNWQQIIYKYKDVFVKYNCSFFSKFYYDTSDSRVMTFNENFKVAFGREQYVAYPQYGLMGYDMGQYFLNAYCEYGEDFEEHLDDFYLETLQTPLSFERKNSHDGFYNNKVMFVGVGYGGVIEKDVY